jgi:predicted RNase H-like nuclease (RuvC/YqgF family)
MGEMRKSVTVHMQTVTENLEALKNLIQNDIIGSIEGNLRLGNITEDDARKLKRQTHKLYDHIYAHYSEMEELNEMTDESLMLDIDIIEKRHEQELAKKDEEIAKGKEEIAKNKEEIQQLKKMLEALQNK